MDALSEHVMEYRRCTVDDVFKVGADLSDADKAKVDAIGDYLSAFVAPNKANEKNSCFHCGSTLDGMMHALGVGAAAVWGLAHGEAVCSKCRWPMRGMHYIKDANGGEILALRNFFLSYHPDQVEVAA